MMYRGWGWGWGMGWGGGLLMCLVGILFIALVIMIIVRLIRHGGYHSMTMSSTKQTPLDIAKERNAKGEITKEQFEQMKKDLS